MKRGWKKNVFWIIIVIILLILILLVMFFYIDRGVEKEEGVLYNMGKFFSFKWLFEEPIMTVAFEHYKCGDGDNENNIIDVGTGDILEECSGDTTVCFEEASRGAVYCSRTDCDTCIFNVGSNMCIFYNSPKRIILASEDWRGCFPPDYPTCLIDTPFFIEECPASCNAGVCAGCKSHEECEPCEKCNLNTGVCYKISGDDDVVHGDDKYFGCGSYFRYGELAPNGYPAPPLPASSIKPAFFIFPYTCDDGECKGIPRKKVNEGCNVEPIPGDDEIEYVDNCGSCTNCIVEPGETSGLCKGYNGVDELFCHGNIQNGFPQDISGGSYKCVVSETGVSCILIAPETPPSPPEESTSSFWSIPSFVNEEDFKQGYSKKLSEKQRLKVKIDDTFHYVGAREIDETTAIIEISSTPQQVEFNINEEKKFDLNEDGYYDLIVRLNSIENNKADVFVQSIYEEIDKEPEDLGIEQEDPVGIGSDESSEAEESWMSDNKILVSVVLIIIIIGIIVLIWKPFKVKSKKSRKRRK